ncbi:hypothetical protein GCM10009616_11120 [Microlunatus lacustris]
MSAAPRPLRRRERDTLEVLLAVDFPGVEALRAQLPGTVVVDRCRCGCPSVSLQPPVDAPLAAVADTVPVEAVGMGAYGQAEAMVLLFVRDGRLSYLECAPLEERTPRTFPPVHRIVDAGPARLSGEDEEDGEDDESGERG